MEISRDKLSRHYASLRDAELLAIDRNELTDVARQRYDDELTARGLAVEEEAGEEEASEVELTEAEDDELTADWLDSAAVACSFQAVSGRRYGEDAERACTILRNAGIPSHVLSEDQEGNGPDLLNVMVPGALSLKAASVLDRDLFNAEMEDAWRAHFDELSDDDLRAFDSDDLCAGLLDRAARLKRVYEEAVVSRNSR
jgi:hypothetical protein